MFNVPVNNMEFFNICLWPLFILLWKEINAIIHTSNSIIPTYRGHKNDFLIQKVSMTQKGYIQFLRYVKEVPPLHDYTFCVWINSVNFTHNHPILSYSKHEEERLIRVWISSYGNHINLEIMNEPVFKIMVNMSENHWYHVCQSWSSHTSAWTLHLNGKLKGSGFAPKLKNVVIGEGGDIVVGQEYTDFDKGLDDGIEGHVFGFNFVLSPTTIPSKQYITATKHSAYSARRHSTKPLNIYGVPPKQQRLIPVHEELPSAPDGISHVVGYFNAPPPPTSEQNGQNDRQTRGLLDDVGRNVWSWIDGFAPSNSITYIMRKRPQKLISNSRIYNNDLVQQDVGQKTLGQLLVELSYDCRLGKGAPVNGDDVLISWTRTPVRVFGGAILKRIPPFCN